jgi:hypothetical protein
MDREGSQGNARILRRGLLNEVTDGIFSAEKGAFDALLKELAQAARKEVFAALVLKCTKEVWARVASDDSSVRAAHCENLYTLISMAVDVKALDDNNDQLWIAALGGLHAGDTADKPAPVRASDGTPTFELFTAFTEALLTKCGIKSFKERAPVESPEENCEEVDARNTAVSNAAYYNEPGVIRLLERHGADLQEEGKCGRSPAVLAFVRGNCEAFAALLDSGKVKASSRFAARSKKDGRLLKGSWGIPLIFALTTSIHGREDLPRISMTLLALQKDPTAKDIAHLAEDASGFTTRSGLVDMAIFSRSCDVVRAALEAGGTLNVDGGPGTFDGVEGVVPAVTAAITIKQSTLEVLKMLVDEFGLFRLEYAEPAMKQVRGMLAANLKSYLQAPTTREGQEAFEKAELVARAGFCRLSDEEGHKALSEGAYDGPMESEPFGKVVALLVRCGSRIRDPARPSGIRFVFLACMHRCLGALETAIAMGEDANLAGEYEGTVVTPLASCIAYDWLPGASYLSEQGASPVVREANDWASQPICTAILGPRSEEKSLAFLRLFRGRHPDMLSPSYYKPGPDGACVHPFTAAVKSGRHKCLEWLLTESGANKASLKEACDHMWSIQIREVGTFRGSAGQLACELMKWTALSLLLKHADASVTVAAADSNMPPIYRNPNLKHCPDRRLKALIESAARKELELRKVEADKAATSESKAKAVGAATNAFEDPTNKVLTAAEEKKKAKKKEAKKRAKAKKKAAAHAGAGKAGEDADSDSDSSGEDEEEEGMDEEERMLARAPTFDLEKEKAARKAKAEAEAAVRR